MSSPRLAAAALLLFGSLSLPAGARDPAPDVKTWTVDEGTAGALVEDHRVGLIGIELRFAAGTWSGWAREAHAKEAFEIQLYDSAGSLRARADALAAGLALSMDERRAALRASCLKEDLPEVLALVRDVLSNRDFERAQLKRFAKERQIEWDSSLKDPYYRATQAAVRALFGPTDPRRIGWEKPAPVETATARLAAARDSLLRLPGRAVAFWGDLTREEAERAAAGLLPPVSRDGPRRLEPDFGPVTPAVSRARDHEERLPRLTQVYFSYGRESLPYTDPDYPAFLVADHLLGGHFYSRP